MYYPSKWEEAKKKQKKQAKAVKREQPCHTHSNVWCLDDQSPVRPTLSWTHILKITRLLFSWKTGCFTKKYDAISLAVSSALFSDLWREQVCTVGAAGLVVLAASHLFLGTRTWKLLCYPRSFGSGGTCVTVYLYSCDSSSIEASNSLSLWIWYRVQ